MVREWQLSRLKNMLAGHRFVADHKRNSQAGSFEVDDLDERPLAPILNVEDG